MLARVQKATPEPPLAERMLLPTKPDDLIRHADEKARAASAARLAAETQHRDALHRFQAESNINADKRRQYVAPTVSSAEVDALAAPIHDLLEAEHEAKVAAQRIRDDYQDEVKAALADTLHEYRGDILQKLEDLENLLSTGVRLHMDATSARVELPNKLPGASSAMITHGIHLLRSIVNRVDRH